MPCLLCGCSKEESSLMDLLDGRDPLCHACRERWERKDIRFFLEGTSVWAPYVYNDALAQCLLQFKECGDEALKDVFLYGLTSLLCKRYRGYTLLLMPSSMQKMQIRGFNHLRLMFACARMPMMEPFFIEGDGNQKQKGYAARMEMRGKIRLQDNIKLPERILLCDDTITTGATMLGALDCLNGKAKKISAFSISANRSWLNDKRKITGSK